MNYAVSNGTLLEDFETLGDWTKSLGSGTPSGTLSLDSTNVKTGTSSLNVSATNGGIAATKTVSLNAIKSGVWGFWVYVPDTTNLATITIYISSTTDLSKNFAIARDVSKIRNGWNFLSIDRNSWSNTGTDAWTNTMVRLRVRVDSIANQTTAASFDSLYTNIYARPKVLIIMDDGRTSAYTQAYAYMKTYQMVGTVGVNSANVGTAGWATLAQLQEMYAAGWDMANHSADHPHLTTQRSEQQLTEMTLVTNYLQANGFNLARGGRHFIYPYGEYDSNALANIPTAGFYTARSIITENQATIMGIDNTKLLYAKELSQSISITTAKAYVDNAIATGSTCILFAHLIVTTPGVSTEWPIADFHTLVDYVAHYRDANILDVMTISQWYNGLSTPRRVV